jgi:hypothetical protein
VQVETLGDSVGWFPLVGKLLLTPRFPRLFAIDSSVDI